MASTAVSNFWKAHKPFWFPVTAAQKEEADAAVAAAFWGCAWESETLAGQVIYLDQFARHFQRAGYLTEEEVAAWRQRACAIVREREEELASLDEVELAFTLMPFKHMGIWNYIFRIIYTIWLPAQGSQTLLSFPTLQRFVMDTYKKAYTLERLRKGCTFSAEHMLEYNEVVPPTNPAELCDSYPAEYAVPRGGKVDPWKYMILSCGHTQSLNTSPLGKYVEHYEGKPVIVSLSGGVDSMVLLSLLAAFGANVVAVHINYGNRSVSAEEEKFLMEFCARLRVPFHGYRIPHIRRGQIDRDFYETMTRQLRFWVYQCVAERMAAAVPVEEDGCCADNIPVVLGHIQDDVVENIWTNIVSGTNLDNLKTMRAEDFQMGVRLVRPFLDVKKADIYAVAHTFAIPYLKNTTPSWSNRGKFREHFHAATVAQFGAGVDERMVAFAEAMERQAALVERFVYRPIYDSWDGTTKEINITTAVQAELDAKGWEPIFTRICHTWLRVNRPSAKAVVELHRRLKRGVDSAEAIRVNLSGELQVVVRQGGGARKEWWMKCVVAP